MSQKTRSEISEIGESLLQQKAESSVSELADQENGNAFEVTVTNVYEVTDNSDRILEISLDVSTTETKNLYFTEQDLEDGVLDAFLKTYGVIISKPEELKYKNIFLVESKEGTKAIYLKDPNNDIPMEYQPNTETNSAYNIDPTDGHLKLGYYWSLLATVLASLLALFLFYLLAPMGVLISVLVPISTMMSLLFMFVEFSFHKNNTVSFKQIND